MRTDSAYGDKVTYIRRTAKVELLFRLKKGVDASGEFHQKVSQVLRSNVEIRTMSDTMLLECKTGIWQLPKKNS